MLITFLQEISLPMLDETHVWYSTGQTIVAAITNRANGHIQLCSSSDNSRLFWVPATSIKIHEPTHFLELPERRCDKCGDNIPRTIFLADNQYLCNGCFTSHGERYEFDPTTDKFVRTAIL